MLGADVGTAVMVQVLSLNLRWLAPLAITVGVVVYLSRRNERAGQIGRIILGFGVMILALQLISAATAPLAHGAGVKTLFAQISGDVLLDVVIGAIFSVLCYSSLAVVLLVATLAGSAVLPAHVAIPLVLGANLGSGILAMLTTWRSDAVTRRVPLGNFVFKAAGVTLALALLPFASPWLKQLELNPQRSRGRDSISVSTSRWHSSSCTSPAASPTLRKNGSRTAAPEKMARSRVIWTRSRSARRLWRLATRRAKRSGSLIRCRTCWPGC